MESLNDMCDWMMVDIDDDNDEEIIVFSSALYLILNYRIPPPPTSKHDSPHLGAHMNQDVYLLYNDNRERFAAGIECSVLVGSLVSNSWIF